MPDPARVEKPPSEVPASVVAGKRRALARAVAATAIALGTVGLVVFYAARGGAALGIAARNLVYLVMFACLVLFSVWESRRWREDDAERAERRRARRGVVRWPKRRSEASAGPESIRGPILTRSRPHPARRAVAVWWQQALFVLVLLTVFATALAIVVSAGR